MEQFYVVNWDMSMDERLVRLARKCQRNGATLSVQKK